MTSLITKELNLAATFIDSHLVEINLNGAPDDLNSAQVAKTSNSQPHVLDDPSMSRQRKSKSLEFEGSRIDVQKEHQPQTIGNVLTDPSSSSLRTPVPISTALALYRAMRFQHSLGIKLPNCIKKMCTSQVNSNYWMGFSFWFCKFFLPKEDTAFVLEADETGQQCEVRYVADKRGFSTGWKSFVLQHNLVKEDVLVFQLVEKTKFKVYIFKANDSSEAGQHALSLMNLEAHTEQTTPGNNSEEHGTQALECSRPSKPNVFQEVESLKDFHIMYKGLSIDHKLPNYVRVCYYKLCIYKNELLHDAVSEDFCDELVVAMIGETVRIANEIKNCKITTNKEEFESWDKSLSSLENLGMKVRFLRDKMNMLAKLVFQSDDAVDVKRYVEAKNEHERVKDEIKKVAAELTELKKTANKFEEVAGCLKQKIVTFEQKFQEEIDTL